MCWKILISCIVSGLIMGPLGGWSKSDVRIVGGDVANIADFKYQVALLDIKSGNKIEYYACGGSLIRKQYVLSAAHCFTDKDGNVNVEAKDMMVSIGSNDSLGINIKSQHIGVKRLKVHESYHAYYLVHDIALLELIEPFKSNVFASAIALTKGFLEIGTNCVVSGWGDLNWDGPSHRSLYKVNVKIMELEICNSRYNSSMFDYLQMNEFQICAGHFGGDLDSCNGDSGGPLVCNGKLAGVVSYGYKCAVAGYPAVYANVSSYLKWIEDSINSSSITLSSFTFVLFIWIVFKLI